MFLVQTFSLAVKMLVKTPASHIQVPVLIHGSGSSLQLPTNTDPER